MRNTLLAIFFVSCSLLTVQAQSILKGVDVQWHDLEQAIDDNPDNKNFLLFVYADWCEYCQKAAETTLQDDELTELMNSEFIPVKMNANSKDTLHVLDTDFTYDEESGYHGLPIVLMDGKMTFPSMIFMSPEFTMISKVAGYQEDTEHLTKYLEYIGTNAYKNQSWDNFLNTNQ